MESERWQTIERLYHAALEQAEARRSAFLRQACAGDDSLQREVESLLAHDGETGSFLEAPALEVAAKALVHDPALLTVDGDGVKSGSTLSHYQILEKLGAGGMGEVYRARDTKLGREVALKVLPEGLANDRNRMARFQREAKILASLNHPNIATIHGLEESGNVRALAMELVEGPTLEERLVAPASSRNAARMAALPINEALGIAKQIAEALEYAHERGIIHRDLKPANVKVTEEGTVKVLDFGIAKALVPEHPAGNGAETADDAATPATMSTRPGAILGTPAYMSPEQARGKAVDRRTDIWAFGCVLYETLAGKQAFAGETFSDTLAALLTKDPDWGALPAGTPAPIQTLIRRCLTKDPKHRLQAIGEARIAIEEMLSGTADVAAGLAPPERAQPATPLRRMGRAGAAGALVLIAAAAVAFFYFHRKPALTSKDTIVLADFTNTTGDAVFDDTLRQGLAADLEQSPYLNILSDQRVTETLGLMDRAASTPLTPDVARDVCQRAGGTAVLAGSIASLGSQYVIGLNAVNCRTDDSLAREEVQAPRKEDVLEALGTAASALRRKLGESLASIQKFNTPVEQVTTSSLEALKAYSLGRRIQTEQDDTGSIPFYQRAIELDPDFATAYGALSVAYGNVGEDSLKAANAKKAYELRGRVSEREKFGIAAYYDASVTGDLEKASQTLKLWAETYPHDFIPLHNLGAVDMWTGHYEKALAEFRAAARLNPAALNTFYHIGLCELALDRLDEARANLEQTLARHFDDPFLRYGLYEVAFLKGDETAMQQQVEWAVGKPETEDSFLYLQSDTAAYFGRLAKARDFSARAVDTARRSGRREPAAAWKIDAALREVEFGNKAQGRQDAISALPLASTHETQIFAALALARAGDSSRAQSLADALDKRYPSDTLLQNYWLPTIRAAIEIDRGNPEQAVQILQPATAYELGSFGYQWEFHWTMYSAYLRGEAYLLLHKGPEAATEFQKFIDHSGVVLNFPLASLARLGLARAYALEGDNAKARATYQKFFGLWKDADPDIPVLKEARAEYVKLQ